MSTPSSIEELHEFVIDELDVLRDDMAAAAEAEEGVHEQLVTTLEQVSGSLAEVASVAADVDLRVEKLESRWETSAEKLQEWVDEWLIPTFALEVVLHNWQDNPGIVSELQALSIAFEHMRSKKAHGFDPVNWHSHLASMINRIAELRMRYNTRQQDQQFSSSVM